MVYGRIVEGSPREIGEKIAKLVGERHVAVMLMEEPAGDIAPRPSDAEFEQVMAQIRAESVSVPQVDDSREGIYTRRDGA